MPVNDSRTATEKLLAAFREDLADLDARLAERARKTGELAEERRRLAVAVAELERHAAEEKATEFIRRAYE